MPNSNGQHCRCRLHQFNRNSLTSLSPKYSSLFLDSPNWQKNQLTKSTFVVCQRPQFKMSPKKKTNPIAADLFFANWRINDAKSANRKTLLNLFCASIKRHAGKLVLPLVATAFRRMNYPFFATCFGCVHHSTSSTFANTRPYRTLHVPWMRPKYLLDMKQHHTVTGAYWSDDENWNRTGKVSRTLQWARFYFHFFFSTFRCVCIFPLETMHVGGDGIQTFIHSTVDYHCTTTTRTPKTFCMDRISLMRMYSGKIKLKWNLWFDCVCVCAYGGLAHHRHRCIHTHTSGDIDTSACGTPSTAVAMPSINNCSNPISHRCIYRWAGERVRMRHNGVTHVDSDGYMYHRIIIARTGGDTQSHTLTQQRKIKNENWRRKKEIRARECEL